jgi:hypothetical protein
VEILGRWRDDSGALVTQDIQGLGVQTVGVCVDNIQVSGVSLRFTELREIRARCPLKESGAIRFRQVDTLQQFRRKRD